MSSFRPVVEDGVSSRRERAEIWLSKNAVTFEFKEVFSTLPPRSSRAPLGPKEPPQWESRYRSPGLSCVGLRATSADLLIGTRRDPQYRSVDAIGLIALRTYPSRACT
jgi:hypothetical protein